jgi:DNA-binding NarL/FixJ family response regulator
LSLVRILIVDDFQDWRRFASSVLCVDPSFEIICEVSDGLKAVEAAERLQPDVVLLDIGLPEQNGIEAGRSILKLAPEAKIVFVSQEFDIDIVRATLEIGAWGYVLKSDAAYELVTAIHAIVRGEKFVSRSLAGHTFLDGF